MLLIGWVFPKFIAAVPLKNQTAPTIVNALSKKWIYVYGSPRYLLSDKSSKIAYREEKEIQAVMYKATDSQTEVSETSAKSFVLHY